MKLAFCGLVAIVGAATAPSIASAQSAAFVPSPSPSGVFTPPVGGDFYSSNSDDASYFSRDIPAFTPTMRRQRVALLVALRDELAQLRTADGGTLSDENRLYMTRKTNRLLARLD